MKFFQLLQMIIVLLITELYYFRRITSNYRAWRNIFYNNSSCRGNCPFSNFDITRNRHIASQPYIITNNDFFTRKFFAIWDIIIIIVLMGSKHNQKPFAAMEIVSNSNFAFP